MNVYFFRPASFTPGQAYNVQEVQGPEDPVGLTLLETARGIRYLLSQDGDYLISQISDRYLIAQ